MAFLASTFTFETRGRGVFSGIIAWINQVWGRAARIFPPPHVNVVEGRPSADSYTNRLYMVGGFTRNVLIDEDFRCLSQGILPPDIVPSVAVGAGSVIQLAYLRYYDEITGERSPLSRSKSYTGDENRAWTNLPTDVPGELTVVEGTATVAGGLVTGIASNYHDLRPGDRIASAADLTRWAQVRAILSATSMSIDDTTMAVGAGGSLVCKPVSRVSHVEGWISANGTLPRFDFRVRIGTTAYSESIPALALGEADVDTFEAMPHGSMNAVYNDRQLIAGVQGRLDTLFVSAIGFPERYEGLSYRTDAGEEIVGLLKDGTVTIAVTRYPSAYRFQGYTEDDLELQVFAPGMGGIGHHGNMIAANGIAFIPGREQIQTFNGAFHGAMPTRQPEWAKAYRENPVAFEMGVGAVDPEGQTYRFMPFPLRLTGYGLDGPDENPIIGSPVYFGGNYTVGPDTVQVIVEIDPTGVSDVETIHPIGNSVDPLYNISNPSPTMVVASDGRIYGSGIRARLTDNFVRQVVTAIRFFVWDVVEIDLTGYTNTPNNRLGGVVESPFTGSPDVFAIQIGATAPATTVVYSSIGGIVKIEDTVTIAPANSIADGTIFRFNGSVYTINTLFDGVSGFTSDVMRKCASLGGAWSNVTMPAPPIAHYGFGCFESFGSYIGPDAVVEYDGAMYLFGRYVPAGSSAILKLDSADVVTVAHTPSVNGLLGGVVLNGILYFAGDRGTVGSFDGSTWNDVVFSFQGSPVGPFLATDGIDLWAMLFTASVKIWKTVDGDVTNWKLIHTVNTPGLQLDQLFVPRR